ncbi:MAG: alpha/beta fold hydrolase [Saprospiraceae bacterium]
MSSTKKVRFQSANGHELVGYVQVPADQHPEHFAILAHCFSCTKNLGALREIGRSLTLAGFGILRFDMTGLGESEGEFGNTGFVSNITDIVSAYHFLEAEYAAPDLLIGHSFGGTAALCAATMMPSTEAVVTIGSPSDPRHVMHRFGESLLEIQEKGSATVELEGRPFTISREFVESLLSDDLENELATLNKAILVIHSPQDTVVNVDHAKRIYDYAKHPKSFVSIDGADHMLTNKRDSQYIGQLIASWSKRYLPQRLNNDDLKRSRGVSVRLDGDEQFTTEIMVRHHGLLADEPESVGGNDFGPGPYELVSAGLGACTAMTLQMYARRKKWPLDRVEVELRHAKEANDAGEKVDVFQRTITIEGNLDQTQRERLLEIANKCPVHRTLEAGATVRTALVSEAS